MSERIYLVVNPIATRAATGIRERVEHLLQPYGFAGTLVTERSGHAGELARHAVESGATMVAVLGGDGTVNEAAGALAGSDVALIPFSAGSTNVFARALGWPHPATRTMEVATEALANPTYRELVLGRIATGAGSRLFCVNAGIGLDAETVHRVEAHPWLKTRLRHLGVSLAAISAVRATGRYELTVHVDDAAAFGAQTLVVTCASPYTYLGSRPFDLAPGASFDGRLRWVGLESVSLKGIASAARRAVSRSDHSGQPSTIDGWADREIVVRSTRPAAVQSDGEPLGWHHEIRVTPGPTLRVLIPPGAVVPQPQGRTQAL